MRLTPKWLLMRLTNVRNMRRWFFMDKLWMKMTEQPPPIGDVMGPMDDTPCDEEPDWTPDPDDEEEL